MDYVKILGAPSATATTQTHELELPDGGTLFLLITLHSPEASLTRIEAIRGAVNFLHHEVTKAGFNFESFGVSLEKTLIYPQFEAVCAYVSSDVVYLFALGNMQAMLMRNNNLVSLISGSKTLQSASGYLKRGDSVLLVSNAFLEIAKTEELIPYIVGNKLNALESDTATRVQASEQRGECGILCLSDQISGSPSISVPEAEDEGPTLEEATEIEAAEEELQLESKPLEEPEEVEVTPQMEERPVFAKTDSPYEARSKSKRMAYAGVGLLILLGISIFFGNKARLKKQEAASVTKVVADAQQSLDEAKSISSINKSRARDLITNARDQVLGVHTETKYPELISIKDALTQSLGDVAGVYEIQPTIFSDLTLISQSTTADGLSISDNLVRVLSKNDKRVVTIELPGKRTSSLSGLTQVNGAAEIAAYTKRTFVMGSDGVYDISNSAQKQIDLPANQDQLLFSSFAGNLYVVDKSQNQIWRYSGDGTSFADKKEWLSPGVTVDFSKATAMGIDSSIWVFSGTGKLTKFTIGNPQTIPLSGITDTLSDQTLFFTDSDSESLYFLNPQSKAIYVFDKSGELIATYSDVSLKEAQHFIVSESDKIMIYSVGSKLYSIPIKHIK